MKPYAAGFDVCSQSVYGGAGSYNYTPVLPHDSSSRPCQRFYPVCTHIDDRVLELDVEPVVGNGNDGFVSVAEIFNPFPLKNWERHLRRQHSRIIAHDRGQTMQTWRPTVCPGSCWTSALLKKVLQHSAGTTLTSGRRGKSRRPQSASLHRNPTPLILPLPDGETRPKGTPNHLGQGRTAQTVQ